ncbi:hypothetical protein KKF34_14150 [Myxococcota bacterium]|nr:hypothetical protein [Myxococcota bacterium]MBU1379628.1 hypothetical protein [Myxococcota bacterium]MBU1498015.1 hypothetical protein [Myxococcota bacterium]
MKKITFLLISISIVLHSPAVLGTRKPGDKITVSNNEFIIWGGAQTAVMPKGCSTSPDGKYLFVSNFGQKNIKTISVYSTPELKFIKYIAYKGNSIETIVSSDSKTLYSTNMYGGWLDLVDIPTLKHIRRVKVGGFPKMMLLNRANTKMYMTQWEGAGFAEVDLGTWKVAYNYIGYKNPRGLNLSKDEKSLYIANNAGKNVTVVDLSGKLKKNKRRPYRIIKTGSGPRHTAISPDGKYLYVSILGTSVISVIDTATDKIIKNVPVGNKPKTIEISRDGKFIYTADYTGHSMTVMDTSTYQTQILPLDIVRASGLTVSHDDRFIYVTGWCSDDVWAVYRVKPGETAPSKWGPTIKRRPLNRKSKRDWYGCTIK